MDNGFAFSFFRTYDEWERENRRFEEIVQSIDREHLDKAGPKSGP